MSQIQNPEHRYSVPQGHALSFTLVGLDICRHYRFPTVHNLFVNIRSMFEICIEYLVAVGRAPKADAFVSIWYDCRLTIEDELLATGLDVDAERGRLRLAKYCAHVAAIPFFLERIQVNIPRQTACLTDCIGNCYDSSSYRFPSARPRGTVGALRAFGFGIKPYGPTA